MSVRGKVVSARQTPGPNRTWSVVLQGPGVHRLGLNDEVIIRAAAESEAANEQTDEVELLRAIIAWTGHYVTGASSSWLACVIAGVYGNDNAYPRDTADANRCIEMLKVLPESAHERARATINEVCEERDGWAPWRKVLLAAIAPAPKPVECMSTAEMREEIRAAGYDLGMMPVALDPAVRYVREQQATSASDSERDT